MNANGRRRLPAGILGLALLALAGSGTVPAAESPELIQRRASYTAQLDKIRNDAAAGVAALQTQYRKALEALEKNLQAQGKLDALLAVRKERERFAAEQTVQAAHFVDETPEVKSLQEDYIRLSEDIPVKQARDTVSVADLYRKSLNTLQETLTKSGAIEGALAVKVEKDGIDNRPEVSAAKFTVADAEAKTPSPPAVPAVKPPEPAPRAAAKPTPLKKKYTGSAGNYIKKRFDDLRGLLVDQEYEKAAELIDPNYVKQVGTRSTAERLRWTFPFLRALEQPGVKVSSGDVKVDDKEERATLIPRVWMGNRWNDSQLIRWIQVDGDWYVELEALPVWNRPPDPPPRMPPHRR